MLQNICIGLEFIIYLMTVKLGYDNSEKIKKERAEKKEKKYL